MTDSKTVIAFKGFDVDLKCRGFQYEVGQTYAHDGDVKMCEAGFHACENPLDVWNYYGPCDARFARVEMSGAVDRKSDGDSKVVSAAIHISAELSLPDFIKTAVKWAIDACAAKPGKNVQAASGNYARLAASGHSARLAASGHSAHLAASGDSAHLAASGDYARLAAEGKDSVIASSSYAATAKGVDGTWIALAEFDADGKCVGFATGCAGRDGVPAGVRLKASSGKLVPQRRTEALSGASSMTTIYSTSWTNTSALRLQRAQETTSDR